AVAKETNKTPADDPMSHPLETGQVDRDQSSEALATNDSGVTWGRHEPLKSCVPCHGDQSEHMLPETLHLVAPVPQLCYVCHEDYGALEGWVHGPVATGDCMLCHESHKANNKSLLRKPIPDLCHQCHETKTLHLVANHSDESYAHCGDCHEAHASPGRILLNQDFLKSDAGRAYVRENSFALPRPAFVDRRGSLGGVKGVKVVTVVDGPDLSERYALTHDIVRKKVEMQLRRNGVRVLTRKEQTARQPRLQVHLRLLEVPSQRRPGQVYALSGSLNIFLQQKVELLATGADAKRRFCTATTWDTGAIVIWGMAQIEEGLDEAIRVLVEQFSNDYLVANPNGRAPVTVRSESRR
ncbi:MAG: hypothetical protein JSU70_05735, partial [Phycisphaerales bacterium]